MNKIFLACDSTNTSRIKEIIKQSKNTELKIGYKFGLEFLNSKNGRKFILQLKNKITFGDYKFSDIPNTCFSAIKAIKDLKFDYCTIHISSGLQALKTAKKAAGKTKLVGVTILTSLDNKALKEIGFNKDVKKLVYHQAKLASKAKLDAIVCSGQEVNIVKKVFKKEIITPGIRFSSKSSKSNDQKRVLTPKQAYKNGSDWLVIGRPITKGNIKKNIQKLIDHFTITKSKNKHADCIIVLGGDKGVRNYFHGTFASTSPVLGITEGESSGFLAQIELKEFSSYVNILKKQNFTVEEVPRLGVKIDGKNVYPVLNDVAVFSSKSAMLMEHTLRVNGDEVWHDNGDGIIISTPIGSSAYSMSVGGPVLFQDSAVFEIISVNSLNITRRPLIVSNTSFIEIDDISARLHCEVVLDGLDRYKVKKTVECSKSIPPAKIIRLKKDTTGISALAKKVHLAEDLLSMPPSSKLLLKTLEYEGELTQKDLANKTLLPDRTVRLALSHLLKKGYVKKRVSIRDARQKIYEISKIE